MHKLPLLILFAAGLFIQQLQAQRDYNIYLASGAVPIPEMYAPEDVTSTLLQECSFLGSSYVTLQFYDIPTPAERAQLEALGIELLGYIPNYAFLAKVPQEVNLNRISARAVFVIKPEHKLSEALMNENFPAYALAEEGVKVRILPQPDIAPVILMESLKRMGFEPGDYNREHLALIVPGDRIRELAAHPAVMHVQLAEPPPVPEGLNGRTSSRINLVGISTSNGYDGSGLGIAIADDGSVSHIDFQGRLTDFTSTPGGNHGDMTAGLAVGAGNLNPLAIGMAPGAHLHLYPIDGYPHIDQAPLNLLQQNVPVTSTSYREGCAGVYSQSAQFVDRQVYSNPALLHFFSAGNAAGEGCGKYGNLTTADGGRFGNITGGRKAGKNILTIGNVWYDDRIMNSSSRGPAADGRIKPDLVAQGQGSFTTDSDNGYRNGGGTSAAAPTAAGAALLLYQAYRERNGNSMPNSALIKAAMLNTAEDLGNPGPDYTYGWGRIHVGRAMEVLQNNWYTTNSVSHGAKRSHSISIPQGTRQVRVMVYWHDTEGLPFAGKTLVNDLDMTLQTPFGQTYRPWVLSTTANRDSLNKPAYRGTDHVNNAEQITLDNPASGNYTISIDGYLVPGGSQSYTLAYYFIREDLKITYPVGGEGFVPGETEVIRWDATGNTGTFTLEYSMNNGASWQLIVGNIAGHLRHFDWQVPNIAESKVRIRVRRAGQSAISPQPFSIFELPDFQFRYINDNTAAIRWQPVPGANVYDVFALGEQYMERIGSTTETSFLFNIATGKKNWFSVRARNTDGAVGRRAIAKTYEHQPCEQLVTLRLAFDLYPAETYWDIRDANNRIWAAGGPYAQSYQSKVLDIDICLPTGCYTLNMYDTYNDGMCCNGGEGSYRLTDGNGRELVAGSEYVGAISHPFCIDDIIQTTPLAVRIENVKNVSCFQESDGQATAVVSGGNSNYTYRWSNGATTATVNNLKAGTHRVTVSDGIAQMAASVSIAEPPKLEVQLSAEYGNCSEGDEGFIIAKPTGGTPPYRYFWNNGSQAQTVFGIAQSNYRVTVTDANNCSVTSGIEVSPPIALSVRLTAKNVRCHGGNNGESTAQVSGGAPPYSFIWSNGSNTTTARNLAAGVHSITVTDGRGCEATAAVHIGSPSAIGIEFDVTHVFGTSNGAITTSVSGGQPGYTFRWSNGAQSANLSNLGPGTFTLTVTDSKGCTATRSVSVQLQDPANCTARGSNTRFEWIEQVRIGAVTNASGNDGGYGDYRNRSQVVAPGDRLDVLLTPGFQAGAFREFWRIWIDWNQDGDFLDANEEVFAANGATSAVEGSFYLPLNIPTGKFNMRVSMRYGSPPLPCGTFPYGEVEDYRLEVMQNSGLALATTATATGKNLHASTKTTSVRMADAQVYPNPSHGEVMLDYDSPNDGMLTIVLLDATEKIQLQKSVPVSTGANKIPLTMKHVARGSYILQIFGADELLVKRLLIF